jgi:glycine betaine/proline transport system permease protein
MRAALPGTPAPAVPGGRALPGRLGTGAVLLAVAGLSWLFASAPRGTVPPWALELPRGQQIPFALWLRDGMRWLVEDAALGPLTFRDLTRAFAWVMEWPLWAARSLLVTGIETGAGSAAIAWTAPVSWAALIALLGWLAWRLGDRRLAALVTLAFVYLALFGQWRSAMITLSSIVIAVPFAAAAGLGLGIWAVRSGLVERILRPVLDLMQTVPVFAYLVPILILFGFGPVSAMLATIVYAMPPMVRVTMLALRQVPPEITEFGRMAGCTERQLLWKVQLPTARPALMVGVNQVIMLSLNMVIIASMIGAGGLGYDVLTALRRLDIGAGLEAGLAITVLAIALDRLSQAAAGRERGAAGGGREWVLVLLLALAVLTMALGRWLPWLAAYPAELQVSTAPFWADLVRWINVHFFDQLDAFKAFVLINLLVPTKRFLLAQPWPWVIGLLALLGLRLGGWRLGLLVAGLALFIVAAGQWANAMTTVYLCGVSVLIAALLGMPIGIASGLSPPIWRGVQPVIDTLQTLPSFVYLIPVVMLFRVGDFAAMIAVVLYAIAPAIRYTRHGIARTPPDLLEAGTAAGCTKRQILARIRLPLALPEMLLGLNQTIMLALSMLVITALVGTRDLGQEVYIALTKADVGLGLVAGLCVAAIAIIADRLIAAAGRRVEQRLGLAGSGL